jgi:hypothetical protein
MLVAYADQHLVERNFGFLKDDMIVNSLFLKTPKRIEALGLMKKGPCAAVSVIRIPRLKGGTSKRRPGPNRS